MLVDMGSVNAEIVKNGSILISNCHALVLEDHEEPFK